MKREKNYIHAEIKILLNEFEYFIYNVSGVTKLLSLYKPHFKDEYLKESFIFENISFQFIHNKLYKLLGIWFINIYIYI